MIKSLTFAIGLLLSGSLIAQTSFFSDDFESGSASWTQSGGAILGCGTTGTEQFAYADAPSGIYKAIGSINVDAGYLSLLSASFDYRIDGAMTEAIAELVYSTNGCIS